MTDTRPLVLALDVATQTGISYGRAGGSPFVETWNFSQHKDLGVRSYRMMVQTNEIIEKLKPALVVIEKPLAPAVLMDIGATMQVYLTLVGLVGVALAVCGAHETAWRLIDRQQVLMHFTGRARYARPGKKGASEAKAAVQARCRQLGWAFRNEDEADAAALWDCGCSALRADLAIEQGLARPVKGGGGARSHSSKLQGDFL